MANQDKKIVIDVQTNSAKTIKQITDLNKQLTQLKTQQQQINKSTDDGKKLYTILEDTIKKVNKVLEDKNILSDSEAEKIETTTQSLLEESNVLDLLGEKQQKFTEKVLTTIESQQGFVNKILEVVKHTKTLKGSFDTIGASAKSFGKSFLSIFSNPAEITVTAVMGLKFLSDKLLHSTKASEKLKSVCGSISPIFGAVLNQLKPISDIVGNKLGGGFLQLEGLVKSLTKTYADFGTSLTTGLGNLFKQVGLDKAGNSIINFSDKSSKVIDKSIKQTNDIEKAIKGVLNVKKQADQQEAQGNSQKKESVSTQTKLNKSVDDATQSTKNQTQATKDQTQATKQLNTEIKEQKQNEIGLGEAKEQAAQKGSGSAATGDSAGSSAVDTAATTQKEVQGIKTQTDADAQSIKQTANTAAKESTKQNADSLKQDAVTNAEKLKGQKIVETQKFVNKKKADKQIFDDDQKQAKKKLDEDKKSGKLTIAEYNKQLDNLKKAQNEFNTNQEKDVLAYCTSLQTDLNKMLGTDTDTQIKNIKSKYKNEIQTIIQMGADIVMPPLFKPSDMSDADFQKQETQYRDGKLKICNIVFGLEQNLQGEIQSLVENHNKAKAAKELEIDRATQRTKLEEHIKNLEAEKAAQGASGGDTSGTDIQINAAKKQLTQLNAADELNTETQSAHQKYEIRKKSLEKQLSLCEKGSEKEKQINADLAANKSQYLANVSEKMSKYGGAALQALGGINQMMNDAENAELEQDKANNDQKKANLKEQLDKKLISQDDYNKQVHDLDASLDKKKAKIAREQAIREKAMKVGQIVMSTATAVMQTLAGGFGFFSIPLAAIVAGMGVAQIAKVIATPLPKASRGMLLHGASHAQGGIPIEAEGGEAIINKHSTSMFAPLLSAINQAGGGVPFTRPFADGGFTYRSILSNNSHQNTLTKQDLVSAVKQIQVVATIEDFQRANTNYNKINFNDIDRL